MKLSIWKNDIGKVRRRKAVDTAIKVIETDVAFFFRSLILYAWPDPRLSFASRRESLSFHTKRLLLTARHSQGNKENINISTQLHIS